MWSPKTSRSSGPDRLPALAPGSGKGLRGVLAKVRGTDTPNGKWPASLTPGPRGSNVEEYSSHCTGGLHGADLDLTPELPAVPTSP
jgi:hypothetical protein